MANLLLPQYLVSKAKYSVVFLLLLLAPLPFHEVLADPYNLSRFLYFSIVLIAGFWFLRKTELVFPPTILFLLLAAFYLLNLVSAFWALNVGEALYESQKVYLGLCTVAFFLNYVRTDNDESLLVSSMLWVILFCCLLSTAELMYYGIAHLDAVKGFSENRVFNASLLMLFFPFTIYGIFRLKGVEHRLSYFLVAWLLILIVLLNVKSVLLATSIGLTAILIIGLRLQNRFSPHIYKRVCITWTAILISYLIFKFHSSMTTGSYSGLLSQEKQALWKKTWQLFLDNPWWGVGAANWPFHIMNYGVVDLPQIVQFNIRYLRPENDLLWVLAEMGLVCFLIMVLKMVTILYYSFREIFRHRNLNVLIFFSFLCALIIHASFSYPKERISHIVFSCLILALLLRNLSPGNLVTSRSKLPLFFGLLILTIGFVFGMFRFISERNAAKMMSASLHGNSSAVIIFGKRALNGLTKIAPDGRPIAAYMGMAYVKMGKADSAAYYLDLAKRSSPYDFEILFNYAKVLRSSGKDNAWHFIECASKINPDLEKTLEQQ